MTDIVDIGEGGESNLPAVIGPPSETEWAILERQAAMLAKSGLVPSAFRGKAHDVMVVALTGRELALPPMMAINKIHVIEGRPTLSAELMRALILRAGHDIIVTAATAQQATVRCRRRGSDETSDFTFNTDDAANAGLLGKSSWKKHPTDMLIARATSRAARAVFPDVLMGVSYVPEELGADVDPFTGDMTGVDEEIIAEGQARDLLDRIDALDDVYRASLRDVLREMGVVIARRSDGQVTPMLPTRRLGQVEIELAGLEQWGGTPSDKQSDDDDVAEGEVLDDPKPEDDAEIIADADVLEATDA